MSVGDLTRCHAGPVCWTGVLTRSVVLSCAGAVRMMDPVSRELYSNRNKHAESSEEKRSRMLKSLGLGSEVVAINDIYEGTIQEETEEDVIGMPASAVDDSCGYAHADYRA